MLEKTNNISKFKQILTFNQEIKKMHKAGKHPDAFISS